MPEITSVEAIQAKLKQFDEHMDGAIVAARTLSRIRNDAEKVLAGAENARSQSDAVLRRAEAIRVLLEQLHGEWSNLKKAFNESQAESQEIRNLLLSELDSALKSLDGKIVQSEERLRATHEAALAKHEDALKRLEDNTREHAERAANASVTTRNLVQQTQDILNSQFQSSQEALEKRVQATLEMLNSEFQAAKSTVVEQAASQGRVLRDDIKAFKEEMCQDLKEHQQGVDRELTDFLNKQNALVQNLSQQIDGFHRAAQALSSDLAQTKAELDALNTSLHAQKKESDDQVTSLSERLAEVSTRLETTITALKRRSWLTGLKE